MADACTIPDRAETRSRPDISASASEGRCTASVARMTGTVLFVVLGR